MTDDEIIAVVQEHKEGKMIEGRLKYGNGASLFEWRHHKFPTLDFPQYDYRVAPEPRKPREFWLVGGGDRIWYEYPRKQVGSGQQIRVREVIE